MPLKGSFISALDNGLKTSTTESGRKMPTPNPEYNPHWQIIHDYHSSEIGRLNKKLEKLAEEDERAYKAGARYNSAEMQTIRNNQDHLRAEVDFHAETCRRTFRMQYPTVQEYAATVFRVFDPTEGKPGARPLKIDFEKFASLDEVGKAWSKARKAIEDEARNELMAKTLPRADKTGFKLS